MNLRNMMKFKGIFFTFFTNCLLKTNINVKVDLISEELTIDKQNIAQQNIAKQNTNVKVDLTIEELTKKLM